MDSFMGKLFPFMGKPKEEPPKPPMKTEVDFKQRRGRSRGTTALAPALTASQLEEFKMAPGADKLAPPQPTEQLQPPVKEQAPTQSESAPPNTGQTPTPDAVNPPPIEKAPETPMIAVIPPEPVPKGPSRLKYFADKVKRAYRRGLRDKIAEQTALKAEETGQQAAREAAEQKARDDQKTAEAAKKAQDDEDRRVKALEEEEQRIKERLETEQRLREETKRVRDEAERKAKEEETRRRSKELEEEAALRRLKEEEDRRVKEEQEEERRVKEEQAQRVKAEDERKAREEEERRIKEEEAKKAREEEERRAKEEEERRLKEEQEKQLKREEEERIRKAQDEEQRLKDEQEQRIKEENARLEQERLQEIERAKEAERLEEERLKEEARVKEISRLEAEKLAEAARLEAERLKEMARLEEERLKEAARLEEERLKEEEIQKQKARQEMERLKEIEAAEKAAKIELERVKEQARIEEERVKEEARLEEARKREIMIAEEQARLELERLQEKERLEILAKKEQERLEEIAKIQREELLAKEKIKQDKLSATIEENDAKNPKSTIIAEQMDTLDPEVPNRLNHKYSYHSEQQSSGEDPITSPSKPVYLVRSPKDTEKSASGKQYPLSYTKSEEQNDPKFDSVHTSRESSLSQSPYRNKTPTPEPSVKSLARSSATTDLKPVAPVAPKNMSPAKRNTPIKTQDPEVLELRERLEAERRAVMSARVERVGELKMVAQRERELAAKELELAKQLRDIEIEKQRIARENWKLEVERQKLIDESRINQMKSEKKKSPINSSRQSQPVPQNATSIISNTSRFDIPIKQNSNAQKAVSNESKQKFDAMCRDLATGFAPGSISLVDLAWDGRTKVVNHENLSSFVLSRGNENQTSDLYFLERFPASQITKQSDLEAEGVGLVWKHGLPIRGFELLTVMSTIDNQAAQANPSHRNITTYSAGVAGLIILPLQITRTTKGTSASLAIKVSSKGRALEKHDRDTHLGCEDRDWTLRGQRLALSQRGTVYWLEMPDSVLEVQGDQVVRRIRVKLRGSYQTTPFKVEFLTSFVEGKDTLLLLISCTKTDFKQLIIKSLKEEIQAESVVVFGNSKFFLTPDLQQMHIHSMRTWNTHLLFIGHCKSVQGQQAQKQYLDRSTLGKSPIRAAPEKVAARDPGLIALEHFTIDFFAGKLSYLCNKVVKFSSGVIEDQLTSFMLSPDQLMLASTNESMCFKISVGNPPQEVERRTTPHRIVGIGRGENLGGVICKDYSCYFVGYLKYQDAAKSKLKKSPKQIWKEDERTLMRAWESKFDQDDEESFFDPGQIKHGSPQRSFIKTTYSQASDDDHNLGATNSSILNYISQIPRGSEVSARLQQNWSKVAPIAPRTEAIAPKSRNTTPQAVKSSAGKPTATTNRPVSPIQQQQPTVRRTEQRDRFSPVPRKGN